MLFYSQGDRPGKFLANRVRILAKIKIPYIASAAGNRVHDPRDIADAFADYYSDLYNLKNDDSLPTPSSLTIQEFLGKISPTPTYHPN